MSAAVALAAAAVDEKSSSSSEQEALLSEGQDVVTMAESVTGSDNDEDATTAVVTPSAATAPSTLPLLDVATCSPTELAQYLQRERFAATNDATTAKVFLEQALKALSTTRAASAREAPTTDLGAPLSQPLAETTMVSCLTPRCGKVSLLWYQRGVQAVKHDTDVAWTLTNAAQASVVERILVVRRPQDWKKPLSSLSHVLILLHGGTGTTLVTHKQKSHSQIGLMVAGPPLPKKKASKKGASNAQDDDDDEETAAPSPLLAAVDALVAGLQTVVGKVPVTRVVESGRTGAFCSFVDPQSSTTTGGLPFVACYHGTRDGVLFPLRDGLLFGTTTNGAWQFVSGRDMHRVAAGRGNSRFVDLQVALRQTDDDHEDENATTTTTMEFTNIDRAELPGLNEYLHRVLLPAMRGNEGMQEGGCDSTDHEAAKAADRNEAEAPAMGRKRKASQAALLRIQDNTETAANNKRRTTTTENDDEDEEEDDDDYEAPAEDDEDDEESDEETEDEQDDDEDDD